MAFVVSASAVAAAPEPPARKDLAGLLARIHAIGNEGTGNESAARAWKALVRCDASDLPILLAALDDAGPLAANWIHAAIDAVAERTLRNTGALPARELEQFVHNTAHSPHGRRLAFDWLARVDQTAPDRLIPAMLHDPGAEFRRDAVARLMAQADRQMEQDDHDQARQLFRRALSGSVHEDQIKHIAKQLNELGVTINLPSHFGFVTRWKLVGPFDNQDESGFNVAYPPETEPEPADTYPGTDGPVRWREATTDHDYGIMDLNQAVGRHKGAIAYGRAKFASGTERPAELRMGCINAVKVWLNGELLFAHEEYHHGMKIDQYRLPCSLRKGVNVILVKVCQNEQTEDWAQDWKFQLRVCDAAGSAIAPADRTSR